METENAAAPQVCAVCFLFALFYKIRCGQVIFQNPADIKKGLILLWQWKLEAVAFMVKILLFSIQGNDSMIS